MSDFSFYYKEKFIKIGTKLVKNSIYEKNILKGNKILIVMLWTNDMSSGESPFVNPNYIFNPNNFEEKDEYFETIEDSDNLCLKYAADYYGVELKVVLNYEDAINEIASNKEYCEYYSVWVMCGPPYEMLPKQESINTILGKLW